MKSMLLLCTFFSLSPCMQAQNSFRTVVKDAITNEALSNVSVIIRGSERGTTSDSAGVVRLKNIPDGKQKLTFSHVGYVNKVIELNFPGTVPYSLSIILMFPEEKENEEVIVSSGRTDSRIENTPTRVEVLGSEEVNEEVGIKPGNIASLLGDIAGIQTQQTSASTGNTEMRVQGLPGKYTQLLKDGMPLFGGYSGSFSILQIPPLDLKQIEIAKGAISTLYGGGAIAGMINLISKRPKEGVFEKTILINQSTLKESNANVYLSNRKNKLGYTFFTGINHQVQTDVNNDGFSDVPRIDGYFIHPSLFIYPDKNNLISLGYNGVFEKRKGGDMQTLKGVNDANHQYFNQSISHRNTIDGLWEDKINTSDRFTLKGTASWFNRDITTTGFGMKARQLSYYTEASCLKKTKKTDFVAGINMNGESFKKHLPDSTKIKNDTNTTLGFFLQDDWRLSEKTILETGIRIDHHSQYGNFVLPRVSFLYHINHYLTSRLGGGLGYKTPTLFSSDVDEREYPLLLPLSDAKSEKSVGANWDLNFNKKISGWDLTINQTFYITSIHRPLILADSTAGFLFANAPKPITTTGFESYVQLKYDEVEIYLGYTYTVAKKLYDDIHPYLSLSARNKFASVIAWEFTDNFRAGIEAALTGRQYLDDGTPTPAYLFAAAMMRYDYHAFSFVLNCENVFDYRQTKKENILIPPLTNPGFRQLWAPIDGRVVNFSVRIKL